MKSKCNLFGLFSRGVTTTHPLCSVFILSFVFVFCFFSVSVRASVSNIPELSDWQFQQALDAYSDLTDDQKDIANFLTGSQGYAFAGIANSNLNSNFSSFSETIESAKNYGAKMWDQISSFGTGVANNMVGVTNDLSNFFGSAVTYAKTRSESFSAWLGNVGIDYNSSSEFRIQFGKDQAQNNIDFYGDQGLYNWQKSSLVLNPADFPAFNNTNVSPSGNIWQQYYSALNNIPSPHVQVITYNNQYYDIFGTSSFGVYHNIFANTTTNSVYLCDDFGNQAPSTINCSEVAIIFEGEGVYTSGNQVTTHVINYQNYGTLGSLFEALSVNPNLIISQTGYNNHYISLCDFVTNLYIGSSWNDKAVWTADYDLNLTSTSQYTTVNSPTNVIYLDLNGFMHDLYENPTIIYNYVINNSIDGNGDPVDSGDFNPISKYITIPSSGISIGSDFFKLPSGLSLFDTYIADLWRNTKDMVIYCADILNVFTPDEGIGLAYIVYGGIAVGVIGGIFSKFLL